jgi:hypothetical protein
LAIVLPPPEQARKSAGRRAKEMEAKAFTARVYTRAARGGRDQSAGLCAAGSGLRAPRASSHVSGRSAG